MSYLLYRCKDTHKVWGWDVCIRETWERGYVGDSTHDVGMGRRYTRDRPYVYARCGHMYTIYERCGRMYTRYERCGRVYMRGVGFIQISHLFKTHYFDILNNFLFVIIQRHLGDSSDTPSTSFVV